MMFTKQRYKKSSDEELVRFVHEGNETAFNELYQRYSQKLLYYFFRMLGGNNERAQDLLQDIFMKLIDKQRTPQPIKNFSAWIFTVANNMCKNVYRNNKIRDVFDTSLDLDDLSANDSDQPSWIESSIDRKYFETALLNKLNQMTMLQRSTFLLKFQENFTIKEISKILNCSEGTIKSRLFKTTKLLAKALQAYDPNAVEV